MKKSRVYIVDRHALIRRGLVELIGVEPDMEVCGQAEEGSKAFNAVMALRPDLVTLEISLDGDSGIELIKSIRNFDPKIGILVVSMCDELVHAPRALRAGARGFVNKRDHSDGILHAIRRIRSGNLSFSEAVEKQMLSRFVRGEYGRDSVVSCLSDRELEVGKLIGGGATTREIAGHLRLSVKTIESHRAHIKTKLDLTNATRLLRFWVSWVEGHGARNDDPMRQETRPGPTPVTLPPGEAEPRRAANDSDLAGWIRKEAQEHDRGRTDEESRLAPAAGQFKR